MLSVLLGMGGPLTSPVGALSLTPGAHPLISTDKKCSECQACMSEMSALVSAFELWAVTNVGLQGQKMLPGAMWSWCWRFCHALHEALITSSCLCMSLLLRLLVGHDAT